MALSLQMQDCRSLPLLSVPAADKDALVEAVVPAPLVAIDEDTYAAWGSGLTLQQYLHRERVMRAAAFSRKGLRSFLLRDGDVVVASCESYTVSVYTKGQRGLGFGIASVYVSPNKRGHGYASELLRRVHEALQKEGGRLCFLMSEIGPQLYQRLGYVGRPLSVQRYAAAPNCAETLRPPSNWMFLTPEQAAAALNARPAPTLPLSIEVSAEQVMWHLLRSRFYATVLQKKLPHYFGMRSTAGDGLCLWAPDYPKDLLRILTFVRGPDAAEGWAKVQMTAGQLAAQIGLSAVEIWENPRNIHDFQEHAGVRSTASDLPMLLGLSPEVHGANWLDYERAHWL